MNSRNRRWPSRLAWFCAAWVVGITGGLPPAHAESKALLIGVAKYPAFESNRNIPKLRGPENDVDLLTEVLVNHGFQRPAIRILSTAKNHTAPTRANILTELHALASQAAAEDQIVIYLSGHGSQQPAEASPGNRESDGLDEVFLPSDTQDWSPAQGRIPGAITDNELGGVLRQIGAKGAFVWFIADTCHSGTMTRGVPGIPRNIPAQELVPADRLPSVSFGDRSELSSRVAAGRGLGRTLDAIPQLIEMYACHPGEITRELLLSGVPGQYNGLFTYQLVQALQTVPPGSTYSDLMEHIRLGYAALGSSASNPMLVGDQVRRQILGNVSHAASRRLTVHQRDGKRFVTGGRLAGLQIGTVLRVAEHNGSRTKPHPMELLVTDVSLTEARVEPLSTGPIRSLNPMRVPLGIACEIVSNAAPDLRLRLWVSPTVARTSLRDLEKSPEWRARIDVVELSDAADWILEEQRPDAGGAFVLRSAWSASAAVSPHESPVAKTARDSILIRNANTFEAGSVSGLGETLLHIARAATLLKAVGTPATTGTDRPAIRFGLGILQLASPEDTSGQPVADSPSGVVLRENDIVQLTITNRSDLPIRVALFYISSLFEIKHLPTTDPIVSPGNRLTMEPYRLLREDGEWMQIVAIAQIGTSGFVEDLSALDQPPLGKLPESPARGASFGKSARLKSPTSMEPRKRSGSFQSPLDHWMETERGAMTRTKGMEPASAYAVQVLNLRVLKEESPANP